jgi:hypothetical protein
MDYEQQLEYFRKDLQEKVNRINNLTSALNLAIEGLSKIVESNDPVGIAQKTLDELIDKGLFE